MVSVCVFVVDQRGFTALMWAACYGHVEIVEKLLKAGANVNDKNYVLKKYHCYTNFEEKCVCRIDTQIENASFQKTLEHITSHSCLRLFTNNFLVVFSCCCCCCCCCFQHKYTALIFAARKGRVDVVEVLLNAGAHVNDKTQYVW